MAKFKAKAKKKGKKSKAKFGRFMRGDVSRRAVDKEEATQEARRKTGFAYKTRFWLPEGGETSITFLDGDLNEDGMLDELTYWEHHLQIDGSWKNWYPCIQGDESCPICEQGEKNSLVAIFTIIDHSKWKAKRGKNAGKTFKDQKRLFVCKKNTLKRLRTIAQKRGGLRGATFDVSRIGDNSENVGDTFDFIGKWKSPKKFAEKYKLKKDDVTAYNYEEIVPNYTRKELLKLGFGNSGNASVGAEEASEADYDGVL